MELPHSDICWMCCDACLLSVYIFLSHILYYYYICTLFDDIQDEDPAVSWMYLQENDLVSFLNQIDMAAIFRSVLYITRDEMGNYAICNS